ncbi:Organic radical activating enzyme [Legionella lansingensis]|uniref:7-carboxy-7-deazaguanine synthase n=1 Tax=Legionella lansingensis TaxID=45067 RepID=A0A0W0VSV4_9GAMM|nr:7-carboxy-7-deazaguanine synthase QueE [Legionella lansingensis]KTD22905.1 radical activating enzyme [Legionella lansingensis]SNV53865.1 Organic radical activating enzyme [Legionella lansingensis]
MISSKQLRITEIFHSLQGESTTVGLPTVFIRLTGCPLRCQYCDTAYAFSGGEIHSIDAILSQVATYHSKHVCVTGGEPLAQPGCLTLLNELCNAGYNVSLETSGARDISQVNQRVMIVMDLKTPGSGECEKNLFDNLVHLKSSDQIKFVLCDRKDYEWACQIMAEYHLPKRVQVLFSPSWGELNPTTLAEWIIKDKLAVRFQLQLHKILWGDVPGH